MSDTPIEQAVAEWRLLHPEDGDLPDEALRGLTFVQMRAAGIAIKRFGEAVAISFTDALRRVGIVRMPADENPFPRFNLFRRSR